MGKARHVKSGLKPVRNRQLAVNNQSFAGKIKAIVEQLQEIILVHFSKLIKIAEYSPNSPACLRHMDSRPLGKRFARLSQSATALEPVSVNKEDQPACILRSYRNDDGISEAAPNLISHFGPDDA
ncbi:hypothetical protein D3C80_1787430 [compost metagenome]